jgi:hypothetical protein
LGGGCPRAKAAGYDQLPSKKATSHKRFRNQACPDANDMNFQEKGKDAKPYQVRQLVGEIEFYDLFRRVDEQNEQ